MTPFRARYQFAFLFAIVIGTAVLWISKPVEAQPPEENYRQQMEDLRAAVLNGAGRGASDTVGALSETLFGNATDFFLPADYDGDGKIDHAVWTPSTTTFKVKRSSDGMTVNTVMGASSDDPTVVADYDGDGRADVAVYRPGASAGQYSSWIYMPSGGGAMVTVTCSAALDCGKNGDEPAPGDYNNDGKSDFVVLRPHTGGACATDNTQGTPAPFVPTGDFLMTLNGGISTTTVSCVGQSSDVVVPGDYDGDGKVDIAVLRGVSGSIQWSIRRSSTLTFLLLTHGAAATDFPTQGDYDGDGLTDPAIWRPNATPGASAFFIRQSTGGPLTIFPYGQNGDYPVANWNAH
jgi:spore coat protein A